MQTARIVNQGAGGFMDPPGFPTHNYSIETDLQRRKENRGSVSLTYAIEEADWLPADVVVKARELLDAWHKNRPAPESREVRLWIIGVMAYFHGCYKGDTDGKYGRGEWAAESLHYHSNAGRFGFPACNVKHQLDDDHAGVHLIHRFYPEWAPVIPSANCATCGHHVNAHDNGEGGLCAVILGSDYKSTPATQRVAGKEPIEGLCNCPRFAFWD